MDHGLRRCGHQSVDAHEEDGKGEDERDAVSNSLPGICRENVNQPDEHVEAGEGNDHGSEGVLRQPVHLDDVALTLTVVIISIDFPIRRFFVHQTSREVDLL